MADRKCVACGLRKPRSAYPMSDSDTCLECTHADAVAEAEETHVFTPETPQIMPATAEGDEESLRIPFPQAEIDYSQPTMQELAARTLANKKLLHFIRRFRPRYMVGWVHEDICRRLERFVEDVENEKEPRLLLCMPVRHGKSEIASRHFPPWVLGRHPDWEIIATSGAQSLALSFSRYQRDMMRDQSYQTVFPGAELDPQSQSVENWNMLAGGGYLAAGVGTMITGRGANILIVDDPVKDAEAADSQVIRDNNWEWFLSTAQSRLAPGGGVLIIMTWWNEDDLAGRVQVLSGIEGADTYEVVKYPAINELGDEYIMPDDTVVELPPGSVVPEGARLTRLHNTALHPERYTLESLQRRKATYYALGQQRWWAALYQQNPTPEEGAFFTKSMFRMYQHEPNTRGANVYQAWDFAITESSLNDYTVGCTVMQDEFDNIYVLDVFRFRSGDGIDLMTTVVDYAIAWQPTLIGFEDGQIWKALETTFTKTCGFKHYYPSYEVLKPLSDKMVRAQPLRGRMQSGKLWWPEKAAWFDALKQEFLRFPAGKHDDQIDSLAWCVRLTLSKSAPRIAEPPRIKGWRDRLAEMDFSGTSHMAA